jgi:FlaA1/EpsC-like NDP-sugar epimerase
MPSHTADRRSNAQRCRTPQPSTNPVLGLLLRYRRVIVIAIHLTATALSGYLAFWLRFDGAIPSRELSLFFAMLPVLLIVRGLTFIPFRLYQGLWEYTGLYDLRNLLAGIGASTVLFYVLVHGVFGIRDYPRSVFIIDSMILTFFMGGVRLTRRVYKELTHLPPEKRVLIFGAGDAGEMIVRDMRKSDEYHPIGFLDDDQTKVGRRIHGVRVLGTRKDLAAIMAKEKPDEVLVAIPGRDPATVRDVVSALEPFKVRINTVPTLRDLISGDVAVSQIRRLSIEDLLPRAPVGLDAERVRKLITGRPVMVTGAGGSIGSELCRQIAALQPSFLVLFDWAENGLYAIENDLRDKGFGSFIRTVIGDVADAKRLNSILEEHHPAIIFHAAAHKHVPLMELNPCEAVKNNVIGTRTVAEAAAMHGVERFVQISTDKAVNPTSVMGATKRVAELIVQGMAASDRTCFVTVRFGNVLGSNGSVVPRFIDQIKAGGPVTVTHPDMRRYFMLISEAVQLVLHSAALGEAGALYALQMGDQIKLVDIARNLIRLSGFVPDDEIAVKFIGLRPGEKLCEELVGTDEVLKPSSIEKVLSVTPRVAPDHAVLKYQTMELEHLALREDQPGVLEQLGLIVSTMRRGTERPATVESVPVSADADAMRGRPQMIGRRHRSDTRVFVDRRSSGYPDRRRIKRGGRRLTDLITQEEQVATAS